MFALKVDDALSRTLLDIKLIWHGGLQRRLCLLDASQTELGCRGGTAGRCWATSC